MNTAITFMSRVAFLPFPIVDAHEFVVDENRA
jgi:hypothetical protein